MTTAPGASQRALRARSGPARGGRPEAPRDHQSDHSTTTPTQEFAVFTLTEDLARDRMRDLRADADAAARARRVIAARRWARRAERATRRAARASAAVR